MPERSVSWYVARRYDSWGTKRNVKWYPRYVKQKVRISMRWKDALVRLHGVTWIRKLRTEEYGNADRCIDWEKKWIDEGTFALSVSGHILLLWAQSKISNFLLIVVFVYNMSGSAFTNNFWSLREKERKVKNGLTVRRQ